MNKSSHDTITTTSYNSVMMATCCMYNAKYSFKRQMHSEEASSQVQIRDSYVKLPAHTHHLAFLRFALTAVCGPA